jgi:hypothetical protein
MVGIQDSGCRIHQVACEISENDRTIAVVCRLEAGHREEERREGEDKAKGVVMCTLYMACRGPDTGYVTSIHMTKNLVS